LVVVVADEQVQQTYFCLEEPVNCFAVELPDPKIQQNLQFKQPLVKDNIVN
jgi:hypothetical protein